MRKSSIRTCPIEKNTSHWSVKLAAFENIFTKKSFSSYDSETFFIETKKFCFNLNMGYARLDI